MKHLKGSTESTDITELLVFILIVYFYSTSLWFLYLLCKWGFEIGRLAICVVVVGSDVFVVGR
jgi:hypothetical protein